MERTLTAARYLTLAVAIGCVASAAAQTDAPTPQSPAPQTPSRKTTGGCYLPDASGKDVFVPGCGVSDSDAQQKRPAPAQSVDPAKDFPFPGETPASNSAQQPSAPGSGSDASKAYPFPGETTAPLTGTDGQSPLKDAGSSGDSSSSSSSCSSSSSDSGISRLPDDPETKGPLADDDTVIKKPRKKAPPVIVQSDADRATEDLGVYGFYMADNNYRGAYLRATDAVTHAPDDPTAHFALAEVARKLGKLDEALAEYKKTLTLDPIPKDKKAAEKAVKDMSGKS